MSISDQALGQAARGRSVVRILVIKLSALGDVVLAFGPLAAIRAHHPDAFITALTTPAYAELLRRSPWVDEVLANGRPGWADLSGMICLARQLRERDFDRVYDLQTSRRSSRYRLLVGKAVEWSGIAPGSSHPHQNPERNILHTIERQREQLEQAGISEFPVPDVSWLRADLPGLDVPAHFALLLPGASPGRPGKRWPRFPELARLLPIPVVVAGTASEAVLASEVRNARPDALDLTGRTSLFQLAALTRSATVVIGNDTGPTHLAAALGRPTLALFGEESDPTLAAPRGQHAWVIQRVPLSRLEAGEVLSTLVGRNGSLVPALTS